MQKKVVILCGASGSGKSTYARKVASGYNTLPGFRASIDSADDYFYVNGEYRFDPSKLPQAHAQCLCRFNEKVRTDSPAHVDLGWLLIVDNTNTTVAEIAPYAALALAYGFELEIVIFGGTFSNVHGVPPLAVARQRENIAGLRKQLPPWWPVRLADND